ncbi:unnamed protein product [Linum tenue]|uniref:Uncharacterized protein n=1 Tax=Linum tenue TaxID=586396 RepID=A0AAV0Q379_9ROSI|nr:unnamed protein product [Linum tenue]
MRRRRSNQNKLNSVLHVNFLVCQIVRHRRVG